MPARLVLVLRLLTGGQSLLEEAREELKAVLVPALHRCAQTCKHVTVGLDGVPEHIHLAVKWFSSKGGDVVRRRSQEPHALTAYSGNTRHPLLIRD